MVNDLYCIFYYISFIQSFSPFYFVKLESIIKNCYINRLEAADEIYRVKIHLFWILLAM